MEIRYLSGEDNSDLPLLKRYRDPKTNRTDFAREEVEAIGRRLFKMGCYVRVEIETNCYLVFGENPLPPPLFACDCLPGKKGKQESLMDVQGRLITGPRRKRQWN